MDDNYFAIDNSLSWKDIAEKIDTDQQTMSQSPQSIEPLDVSEWFNEEHGQLAIDVYETASDLIIEAPIAGVEPKNLDIAIHNDVLTIKGIRHRSKEITREQLIYQECHWGAFSRSVVLPVEVVSDRIDASLENGVLTITLPKAKKSKSIKVKVKK